MSYRHGFPRNHRCGRSTAPARRRGPGQYRRGRRTVLTQSAAAAAALAAPPAPSADHQMTDHVPTATSIGPGDRSGRVGLRGPGAACRHLHGQPR